MLDAVGLARSFTPADKIAGVAEILSARQKITLSIAWGVVLIPQCRLVASKPRSFHLNNAASSYHRVFGGDESRSALLQARLLTVGFNNRQDEENIASSSSICAWA